MVPSLNQMQVAFSAMWFARTVWECVESSVLLPMIAHYWKLLCEVCYFAALAEKYTSFAVATGVRNDLKNKNKNPGLYWSVRFDPRPLPFPI